MSEEKIGAPSTKRETCPGCGVYHWPYRAGSHDWGKKYCDTCRKHVAEQSAIEASALHPPKHSEDGRGESVWLEVDSAGRLVTCQDGLLLFSATPGQRPNTIEYVPAAKLAEAYTRGVKEEHAKWRRRQERLGADTLRHDAAQTQLAESERNFERLLAESEHLQQIKHEAMVAAERERERLRMALVIAETAIEALALSQKDQGMGLLGTHLVVPDTLRRIRDALAPPTATSKGDA